MVAGRIWAVGLALLAAVMTVLPTAADDTARPGRVVNTDGFALRMRAAPDVNAPIIKRLGPDWRLTILGSPSADGRWLRIAHGGATGYVAVGYVAADSNVTPAGGTSQLGRVTTTDGAGLRLRAQPSVEATILKRLGSDWLVTVLGRAPGDDRWLRIEHGGTIGYALADYIALGARPSSLAPVAQARAGWIANTDGSSLRLRATPDVGASILKRLAPGWRVTVLQGPFTVADGSTWVRLEHAGTLGYAAAAYVAGSAAGGGDPDPAPTRAAGRVMTLEVARLRTQPSVSATIITRLLAGTTVESTGHEAKADGYQWRQVRVLGREGWVATEALGSLPATGVGQRLAAKALSYIGRPYVWGAETPAVGFDCSGLVRYVVQNVTGVDLSHVLTLQAAAGQAVERNDLQVGDLVFFRNTYKPGLSHVGFYIGNDQFVNAQNERVGVVIASLNTPYWRDRYDSARRLAP